MIDGYIYNGIPFDSITRTLICSPFLHQLVCRQLAPIPLALSSRARLRVTLTRAYPTFATVERGQDKGEEKKNKQFDDVAVFVSDSTVRIYLTVKNKTKQRKKRQTSWQTQFNEYIISKKLYFKYLEAD